MMRLAMVQLNGNIIARHDSLGGNPQNIGWTNFSRRIFDGIKGLVNHASITMERVFPLPVGAAFGIAGLSDKQDIKRLFDISASYFPNIPALFMSDGLASLFGLSQNGRGMVTISGTGSIAMASPGFEILPNRENWATWPLSQEYSRAGGWGAIDRDPGSGWWFGTQAILWALRVYQKAEKPGPLSQMIERETGLVGRDLAIWAGEGEKSKVAALTPLVFQLRKEDKKAQEIVDNGLLALVETGKTALRSAGLLENCEKGQGDSRDQSGKNHRATEKVRGGENNRAFDIALTGGIFGAHEFFAEKYAGEMRKCCPWAKVKYVKEPAILGLIRLLLNFLEIKNPAEIEFAKGD